VRISVPDTRRPGFAEECRRQARVVAGADAADRDLGDFLVAALAGPWRYSSVLPDEPVVFGL
jgi:hypothetical protein